MKKFSKNLVTFARRYKKFSFVLVMAAVGIGLQIGGLATAARWVLGGTAIILAVPMLIDMIRDLRMGTYGVDVLAITAIVTAVIMR